MIKYQYFTSEELACRCGCGLLNIDHSFMVRIVKCRKFAESLCNLFNIDTCNAVYKVTSGCRCLDHNKKVSLTAPLTSSHIASKTKPSCALDIAFSSGKNLLIILVSLFIRGRFTHIGINVSKRFIHVDSKSAWLWFY